jgi:hypothetical protein
VCRKCRNICANASPNLGDEGGALNTVAPLLQALKEKDDDVRGILNDLRSKDDDLRSKDDDVRCILNDLRRVLDDLRSKDEQLRQLQKQTQELAYSKLVAERANVQALAREGALDARGAMEAIYNDLPRSGKEGESRWVREIECEPHLKRCVVRALGEVSAVEGATYIQANLYKRLCELVHRSQSAAQLSDTEARIRLPDLPPRDKAFLRCILVSYNYPVADE